MGCGCARTQRVKARFGRGVERLAVPYEEFQRSGLIAAAHLTGQRVRIAVALFTALVFVWLLRLVSAWADRTAAAITFFAFIAGLILLGNWLLASFGPGIWRFTRSVALSVWGAVRTDTEVVALVRRHPRLFGWLDRRFSLQRASGLYATVTVASTLYFLVNFVSIALSLVLSRAITRYDPQVLALVRAFRTPGLTRLFWMATLLADPRVIALLALAVVLLLLAWGRRSYAVLVVLTLVGGAMIQRAMELIFDRQRPPTAFALIKEPVSASFPSGHALTSLLFAGVLIFVLWRTSRGLRQRLTALFVAGLVVVAVGASRVYLGVHWLSDVIASWSVAMAVLCVVCGGYLMLVRYRRLREMWPAWSTREVRGVAALVVTICVIAAVVLGVQADPLLARATAQLPMQSWAVGLGPSGVIAPTDNDLRALPLFSEKLDGSNQEPICLVFVGTGEELTAAFQAAGWTVADKPTLGTLGRAVLAAIGNRAYPAAPVTPTFLSGAVQDVAFEKSAGFATVRRRHHARFWKTRRVLNGTPVWVATASFDSRLEIGSAIPLPTHHIDPNIDAEQAYVVEDIVGTGLVALRARLRVTQPTTGTNAQGDAWFTQGYASVLQATSTGYN